MQARGQDDGRVRPRLGGGGGEGDHAAAGGDGRRDPRGRRRARDARDLPVSAQTVRDAMVPEPTTLARRRRARRTRAAASRSARTCARCSSSTTDGTLVGVITRKTLVREVVAAGRDPTRGALREIAEPPLFTLDAVAAARRRLPRRSRSATSSACRSSRSGRLVGVLSRAVVQRRLAEDEPPELDPDPARSSSSSRCRRRAARRPRRARAAPRPRARCRRGCRARSPRSRRARSASRIATRIAAPATITGARSGSSAGSSRRSASGSAASRSSCARAPARVSRWPWTRSRSYCVEAEVERRERRHRAGDADRALRVACARSRAGARGARALVELLRARRSCARSAR